MASNTIQQYIDSFQESVDKIIETAKGLSEETIRWNPVPEEWSIMQIMCHILEAVPYWLGEINLIKANPGAEWGRNHLQERRLAAVAPENVDSRKVEDILNELEQLKDQVAKELGALDEETLAIEAPSRNPNWGTKPISFIVDDLIVHHTSKHFGQIQRNLSKLK